MPAVSANTSASMVASGQARRRLRISGVVSSTSPSRRSAIDQNARARRQLDAVGAHGAAPGVRAARAFSTMPPATPTPST